MEVLSMEAVKSYLSQPQVLAWLSVIWTIYLVVVGVWILLQRRSPAATLSWLLSMAAVPVGGLAIYYFLGPQRLKRQRSRRLRARSGMRGQESLKRLRSKIHSSEGKRLHQVSELVATTSEFPVSSAHSLQLLSGGAETFDSLLDAVRAAQHHVHLEYYIFEPDQTGTALRDALVERAKAGVKVRLLVDALGSKKLGRKFVAPLLEAGGEFALFHPTKIGRRLRPVINFRTHRKILVCDGRVGFTGGVNITDEENKRILPEAYHDVHLRMEGPAVNWLQTVFLEDWAYALERSQRQVDVNWDEVLPEMSEGPYAVQMITSGPDDAMEAVHRAHVAAINAANKRVWLTTPYFVPTEACLTALTNASLRGVDVQIIVPEKSDSRIVTAAARSYFDELLACGVQVYEYNERMLHSKTLVVDDNLAIIGTANFDYRSFFLNYEVCAIAYGESLNNDLALQFQEDLEQSQSVVAHRVQPFHRRLFESMARLCSPLL